MNFKYIFIFIGILATLSTGLMTIVNAESDINPESDIESDINTESNNTVVVEWQEDDNSVNIQQAIDSGSDTVIIPNVNKPWIVAERIRARQPNQKIVFEPGVLVLAKKGAFQRRTTSILRIETDNVTVSGYGATFQMQKEDYLNPNLYEQSEFRHNIVVRGSRNFVVEGLTLKDAGGDGLFISHGDRVKDKNKTPPSRTFSSGIVRDIVADNNYRLGLSIMSAQDLTVENSVFKNSSGTKPASGIDIEPDYEWQRLVNIQFNNNQYLNNDRNGIQIALGKYYGDKIKDVSIAFNGCETVGNQEVGIKITTNKGGVYNGAKGKIIFANCDIDANSENGIHIRSDHTNPDETIKIAFENTLVSNTGNKTLESFPVTLFSTHHPGVVSNIDFGSDFVIQDDFSRPGLFTSSFSRKHGLANIHGIVKIDNPKQMPSFLSDNLENVTLEIIR